MSRMTTASFISRAKIIHHDRYDYSKTIVVLAKKPVTITCYIHGDFLQTPVVHLRGSGCQKCATIKGSATRIHKSAITFLNRVADIHGDKYDYSMVDYKSVTTPIRIICKDHGEFKQTPAVHLRRHGCPKCGHQTIRSIVPRVRYTKDSFIEKAHEVHNNKYEYIMDEFKNTKGMITVVCPEHGIFKQRGADHINGSGCPECGIRKRISNRTQFVDDFVNEAKIVHNNRYQYNRDTYTNRYSPMTMICSEHGPFVMVPSKHIHQHSGCPRCAYELIGNILRSTTDEFIEKAQEIHGDTYDYSMVDYKGSTVPISVICEQHGHFVITPDSHINGAVGCPKCSLSVSEVASKWLDSLSIPDDHEHREVKNLIFGRKYQVDGYDPDTNTIYEFYGDYWHGNPDIYESSDVNPSSKSTFGELYKRTLKRKQDYLDAGYNYVEIWESDWKNQVKDNE